MVLFQREIFKLFMIFNVSPQPLRSLPISPLQGSDEERLSLVMELDAFNSAKRFKPQLLHYQTTISTFMNQRHWQFLCSSLFLQLIAYQQPCPTNLACRIVLTISLFELVMTLGKNDDDKTITTPIMICSSVII